MTKVILNCNLFRFHTYNGTRQSESVPAGATVPDDALYARPPDPRTPRVRFVYCETLWLIFQHLHVYKFPTIEIIFR